MTICVNTSQLWGVFKIILLLLTELESPHSQFLHIRHVWYLWSASDGIDNSH